jgi:cytochrome c-type biogenesis protein CcmF
LRNDGKLIAVLNPEIRTYQVQREPMTEAAIESNVLRDVFVALGEPLGAGAWSIRIRVKPLIGFLWLGSGLMALGGIVAITDRRYRLAARQAQPAAAQPAPGAA